jgi:predicted oxidoreductase
MYRISEGPFYAEKLTRNANIVLVTLAGLFVDGNHQCLDQNFEPIPGLFAIGNTSGGRFPLQYTAPMNGISIGFATVLGALAGEYLGTSAPEVSSGDSATSATGTVA